MDDREVERIIEECRPHWPADVDNAWAVFPGEAGGYVVRGPFHDAEAAHRVSIPAGGYVVYNAPDADAVLFRERRVREPEAK